MKKPKFTEGPWEAVELNKVEALIVQPCDKSKQPICLVDRVPNAWDNGRLLAASPDLYEAVRKAIQLASIANDWNLYEVEIDGEMVETHDLRSEFEAAFKKATA